MSPVVEKQLRIFVEKIVRPLRAAEADKLKMREELFAHACQAYEDEHSRGADQAAAARQAMRRLGEIESTRADLQATVGWQSKYNDWADRFVRRPVGTPVLKHATRLAFRCAVVFAVYMLLILLPVKWYELSQWSPNGRLTLWMVAALHLWFVAMMFFGTLFGAVGGKLAERYYRQRGDYIKALMLVLLASATIGLLGWGFTIAASFDLEAGNQVLRMWLPFTVPLAFGVLILPYLDVCQRRPLQAWLALELPEEAEELAPE